MDMCQYIFLKCSEILLIMTINKYLITIYNIRMLLSKIMTGKVSIRLPNRFQVVPPSTAVTLDL